MYLIYKHTNASLFCDARTRLHVICTAQTKQTNIAMLKSLRVAMTEIRLEERKRIYSCVS